MEDLDARIPGAAPPSSRSPGLTVASDVVVLGGGPAGAAAAVVLAEAGRRVVLVRPDAPPGASLGQSLPPSARALLDDLGFWTALETTRLVPNIGNAVAWAGAGTRTETFPAGEHGYHADRVSLEAVFDGVVRALGVDVRAGLHARAAEPAGTGWSVTCLGSEGQRLTATAPWVVDATGRHGFLARRLGRATDRRTSTLALVGRWRVAGTGDRYAGHTVIGSHASGWAWSVPVGDDLRCVTAMMDTRHTPLGTGSLGVRLRQELAKVPLVEEVIRPWTPVDGSTWACPASLYAARTYVEDGILLSGDAGSFIDPLSSYGVKKALLSGRLAGIVAATALDRPEMRDAATSFYQAHERGLAAEYRARAAEYFEEGAEAYEHPFWTDRVEAARAAVEEEAGPDRVRVQESAVRAAHEALRAAQRWSVRRGLTARLVDRPALRDRRLVMEPHLASDRHPAPVRYFRSVDLRTLVRLAPEQDGVPGLWKAYNQAAPPVDLQELVTALAVTCAAGFLVIDRS